MPLLVIFDVNIDLSRKVRLGIWGQIFDSFRNEVYAITMELLSDRILLTTSAENGLEVIMGDIGNVYLNDKAQENIYMHKGPKFKLVDIMANGDLL